MKKRYIIYLSLIAMIVFGFIFFPPVLPVIQLPGEALIRGVPILGAITNTFIATIIAYLTVIGLALAVNARSRTADEVPTGFYNMFEMIIEGAYGYVENATGRWAPRFFPFFMTFILLILAANWLELVPGVDSIGIWESMGELHEHRFEAEAEAAGLHPTEEELHQVHDEAMAANIGDLRQGPFLLRAPADEAGQKPDEADWTIVPFIRVPATDLNFTVGLALISVLFTQYYGFLALGPGYLRKFFVWDSDKIARNPLGIMDTVVGLIEFISELAKIVSFSFRLFGVIFAGQVLLFVIGFLAPVALVAVYGLEFFLGALQALVFGLLTLTFMAGAVVSHHNGEEHH